VELRKGLINYFCYRKERGGRWKGKKKGKIDTKSKTGEDGESEKREIKAESEDTHKEIDRHTHKEII
jgi:hypothetical protein